MATFTAALAALTTIFRPPCETSWLITTTKVPSQDPPFPTAGPSSCDPPRWAANLEDPGFQYYSPAICPSGFAVGPRCQIRDARTNEGFPAITEGETAVYCVPSGFTCTSDTTDFRGGVWGVAGRTNGPANRITVTVAPAMQIRWREADLAILQTHPLTPGLPTGPDSTAWTSATTGINTASRRTKHGTREFDPGHVTARSSTADDGTRFDAARQDRRRTDHDLDFHSRTGSLFCAAACSSLNTIESFVAIHEEPIIPIAQQPNEEHHRPHRHNDGELNSDTGAWWLSTP
ncbi:hypothetical protein Micbo1qcDRAFT_191163 [Microdochium bolleyi]|uniref:Uncharacterized protein n=1 Tax=Microdochium bolleyi TaxID=196109 RepID=A0A136JGV3_9PEZI|nr:hypothetical protein Micbo1qcDRAFT_191163 [Microdochium bolleyi]